MSMSPTSGTDTGAPARRKVATSFGDVAYVDTGQGPPAVFLHGVFLNADLWHHQLIALSDIRRCIAIDLLAHGASGCPDPQLLDLECQVDMVAEVLDALSLGAVDIVANDSGGAIAQLMAARTPDRLRTMTLTNCDVHDNWPPKAFSSTFELATQGLLAEALSALGSDPASARAVFASTFERPDDVPDQVFRGFLGHLADAPERAEAVQHWVASMDCAVTVAVEPALRQFRAPTLIVWGTDDEFFDVSWSHWLEDTIPGTVGRVEVPGGKLFFPLEGPAPLDRALRELWTDA
jgi:pimeloyl-ACP methyl ester carboxylesterase